MSQTNGLFSRTSSCLDGVISFRKRTLCREPSQCGELGKCGIGAGTRIGEEDWPSGNKEYSTIRPARSIRCRVDRIKVLQAAEYVLKQPSETATTPFPHDATSFKRRHEIKTCENNTTPKGAKSEGAIEKGHLPNKSMRDKVGYLLRAAEKLSWRAVAIGDQYYCPDAGSCGWMRVDALQKANEVQSLECVCGGGTAKQGNRKTERKGKKGNGSSAGWRWRAGVNAFGSSMNCSVSRGHPIQVIQVSQVIQVRELQWWINGTTHGDALRNAGAVRRVLRVLAGKRVDGV